MQSLAVPLFIREGAAPKRVFRRDGKLEVNPLLLQAFGITAGELEETIKTAEEPQAMRDMFAFLSDYATLSDPRTRLSISGDRLDFLVADLKRRMAYVEKVYRSQADEYSKFYPETVKQLLKVSHKARELSNFSGQSRKDKIAFIDAVVGLEHTSGSIIPIAFGISDYGREDYWPRTLLAFLRTYGMPGAVKEAGSVHKVNYTEGKSMFIREEINGFRANPALINRSLAMSSHAGTSFDPEKRGEQEIASFVSYVEDTYERLRKYANTEAEKQFLRSEMERFEREFASRYNAKLSAEGRCLSSMIAGPSNFPVRRAQKACDAADKRSDELFEFRERAEAAILRELKKMGVEEAGGEVEVLKKKIADAERNHEFMVKTNAIVRKKIPDDQKVREIMALAPISEATAREILKPDYMGRIGFPAYALSNDTANIRRMKEHLAEIEKREATPTGEITFPGGSIVDNREADRVQIFFEQRPPQDMISKLKGEGWHWSPSVGAWQRKRTQAAMYSASRITGAVLPVAPAPAPVPVPAPVPAVAPLPALTQPEATRVQAPKYEIGQMVYSYQNPTIAAPIINIHISDDPLYQHSYVLRIPDREGIGTRNSNYINENSLSETPLQQPAAVPPPAVAKNDIQSLARLRASEWFNAQVKNPYERFYLYYRTGDFRVSNEDIPGYTLASAERIPVSWTVEQAAQWMISTVQRLPILPLDAVSAPAPAFVPVPPAPPAALPPPVPQVSPAPVKVPWPSEKPAARKFVQQTFKIEERMRRGYGYGRYGGRGYA